MNINAAETANLSLTLRSTNLFIKVGDEIPIEFVITNRSGTNYTYLDRNYDRSGRMYEYQLKAVDSSGQVLPDPRAKYLGGRSGGLASTKILAPLESFTKTVALNRWALIKAPGQYQVIGIYYLNQSTNWVTSQPIAITVQPRNEQEMAAYLNALQEKIEKQGPAVELVQKLMYTCRPEIIPVLLDTYYKSQGFWETEAFLYYLPRNEFTKKTILNTALKRGLASGMQYLLSQYGCTAADFYPLIERSLAADNPHTWASGALAAQQFAGDSFVSRLIAIATDSKSEGRRQAIYALALNRTDNSVKALKNLLNDPDESIRRTTEQAIRTAYLYRGNSQGRPLKNDDFDKKY